ncbi:MAG: acyltransferase family protein [Patescibacteria group bacterium]|jgi:peptidoglycan/LPS O-acetylase OafA/YrhL
MAISINNPVQATWIFAAIFLAAVLVSARMKKSTRFLPKSLTQELKGLAILTIIFSHFGYFLIADHRFLFPLSILAGVGVDLFLFLSGFGLTQSALKKDSNELKEAKGLAALDGQGGAIKKERDGLAIWKFYRRRLPKLFMPLWIILALYFILDFLILKITYSWQYIFKAAAGFFPRADVFEDLNSPLWYFTLILFYYLIFPWVLSKKRPWLSAIIIYLAAYFILRENPVWMSEVRHLYEIHIIAFPAGIFFGWLAYGAPGLGRFRFSRLFGLEKLSAWAGKPGVLKLEEKIGPAIYYLIIAVLVIFIGYFALNSGVGQSPDKEQLVSIIVVLAIVLLFSYIRVEFNLLSLFGLYSYEVYLLHWPLASRYDLFYRYLPAWLAAVFYLIVFLGLAWVLKKISTFLLKILV